MAEGTNQARPAQAVVQSARWVTGQSGVGKIYPSGDQTWDVERVPSLGKVKSEEIKRASTDETVDQKYAILYSQQFTPVNEKSEKGIEDEIEKALLKAIREGRESESVTLIQERS